MDETHGLALAPLPLPPANLSPLRNPPRQRVRCLRCRYQRKRCDRVPGEDCYLCQKAGVPCGRSLNAKEARPFMARPILDLNPGLQKDDTHIRGTEVPAATNYPYQENVGESDSLREGTAFDEHSDPEEVGMFDREHLGDNISRWSEKLDYLLLFQSVLAESQGPLYPQDPKSSGAAASLGFALKEVAAASLGFASREVARELKWTIEELIKLGDTAVTNGDNDRADRIFLHILDGLQSTSCLSVQLQCAALSQMALFYRDIGNEPRSQKVLRILSSLPTSTGFEPRIKSFIIDPHQMLGLSLVKTSKMLQRSFVKSGISGVAAVIRSPALNQSVRCENPEVFKATLEVISKGRAYGTAEGAPNGEPTSRTSSPTATLDSDEGVNTRDTLDRSPLFVAAALGKSKHCMDLLDAGARVDDRDCNGHTILAMAAGQGLVNPVERILSLRSEEANPLNVGYTSTPLQEAAAAGHFDVVRTLVQHGADPLTIRFWDGGKSALDLARENGHEEVAKDLERTIEELESPDFFTALQADWVRDYCTQNVPAESRHHGEKFLDGYSPSWISHRPSTAANPPGL